MLHLQEIYKSFGYQQVILRDISLSLTKSSIVLLIGDNGAGKTTLSRIIAGLDQATRGVRKVDNIKISYLGEADYLYSKLSVNENLFFAANISGNAVSANDVVESIATDWNLGKLLNKRVSELSRGQRRSVALAKTWILGENLIILDEPFVGLDESSLTNCKNRIVQAKNEGRTFVLVSQTNQLLSDIVEKTYRINEGRLICECAVYI